MLRPSDVRTVSKLTGEQDEELMMKYHISHTMVAKYRKKAIKELDALYEERDRQTESFILR